MTQLTRQELEQWTEAKTPAKQIAVLRENHIPFAISAKGRPVTTWEAINAALSGGTLGGNTEASGFNLEAAM